MLTKKTFFRQYYSLFRFKEVSGRYIFKCSKIADWLFLLLSLTND